MVLRKVVLPQAQLVGESSVKVATQPVQVDASEQEAQLLMAVEHYKQVVLRYCVEEHPQLVGLWRVKVAWHRVQVVLEVQERQFVITEAHDVQVEGGVRN